MDRKNIYKFRVELERIEPSIWRQIEVPSIYNFWELHVAIQDSMGWLDYHLHSFRISTPKKEKPIEIGIPDDDFESDTLPGWEVPLTKYFKEPGDTANYEYDFGDSWQHNITLEGISLQKEGVNYPNCTDGRRACPPEDCGGIPGFDNLLKILNGKDKEEYDDMMAWIRGQAKDDIPYDPDFFDPEEVEFSNPKKRWERAFER